MGGKSSSHTRVETKYVERPLTQEEKDLIRAVAENARQYGRLAGESAERSKEAYEYWKQFFRPLEVGFIRKTQDVNAKLGTPEERLLNLFQSKAIAGAQKGAKEAQEMIKKIFAQRGLSGSGLETKAFAQLAAAESQNISQALADALFKAIAQSDQYRLQRLSNLANVINVGRGFSASGFNYQDLAGRQYLGSGQLYSEAFKDWDMRWKQQSNTWAKQTQKSGVLDALGNVVSFGVKASI